MYHLSDLLAGEGGIINWSNKLLDDIFIALTKYRLLLYIGSDLENQKSREPLRQFNILFT